MAGSISKEALLKILGENKDALAKLEEVTVKADELKAENPTLTVQIDAARARAEAALLKAELNKELGSVSVTVKPDVSQFRTLLDKALGFLTGGAAGTNPASGLSGGPLGILTFIGSGGLPAILAVVAGAAALLTELAGVVSGLVAAGVAVGAFALLALPTLDAVKNAYTNIHTAQQNVLTAQAAYHNAVEKENINPTKANAAAVVTALTNVKVAQENLAKSSTGPGGVIVGLQQLIAEFKMFAAPFQPVVLSILNQGLQIASSLLPYVSQLAGAAAGPIEKLMTALSKGVSSQGFANFVTELTKITPGAITSIATGLGKVIAAFGQLLTVMSAKDVAHTLNIAFDIIAGAIMAVTIQVKLTMIIWDELSSHIAAFTRAAGRDLANWAQVVDNIFTNVNNWFNVTLPTGIATAINWFLGMPSRILAAFAGFGGLLFNAGKSLIDGLVNGIKAAVPGLTSILSWVSAHIPSWKGPEDKDRVLLYPAGQAIIGGLIGGIGSQVPALQSTLSGVTRTISTGVSGGGGRGGMEVVLSLDPSFATAVGELSPGLLRAIRGTVRLKGGGSVQAAFGKAGM